MARKIGQSQVAGAVLYVLCALAIYLPALHGTWLWDDREDLPDNPVLKAAHPLRLIWTGQATWDYYPIKNTLQWMQWGLWGNHTVGYHLTNVVLHVVSGLLLWRLLRRLGLRGGWAWCAGLGFVVHPIAVGSVAWITEFKDSLSLPFLLLAADAYVRHDGAERGPRARVLLGVSFAWFVVALLAKSSVLMFPACLLLYGWYARRPLRRVFLSSLPFFAVSAICGWVAVQLQHHRSLAADGTGLGGFAFRLSLAGKVLAFYLRQALAPYHLSPVYGRWAVGGFGWWALWAALLALLLWKVKTWGRPALLAFGWFVLNLVPVLGVVGISFMRFTWVMDHLAYESLLAVVGLAAAALQWLSDRPAAAARPAAVAVAALGVAVLLAESRAYAPAYRSEEALWEYTVTHRPEQWMGYSNLGAVLINQSRVPEGIALLERAVRINPDAPDAHRNLGVAYSLAGRPAEAVAEARRALQLRPNYLLAVSDLGTYLGQGGRFAEALPYWETANRLNPADADLRNRYGYTLLLLDRPAEGLVQIQRALAINPQFGPAEFNWALALTQAGKPGEALPHFEAAARLLPDNLTVQQALLAARKRLASP
jgi:tetratricopeptide (TPR) repeat protein